jgi:hypothetical protein
MMQLITGECYGNFINELAEMHRLRYRVFKERLDWDVQFSGDMEIDEFDALHPAYLIQRAHDNRVQAAYACSLRPAPPCCAILFPCYWTEHRPPIVRPSGRAAALRSIFLLTRRRQLTA